MLTNCPTCGAPVTGEGLFCTHCGVRLPDSVPKAETNSRNADGSQYEDTARLEEVRLKYEQEEKQRLEKKEAKERESKVLRIKRWVSGLLCIAFLCLGMVFIDSDNNLSAVFGVLFFATGAYAFFIIVMSVFRKR